jgi:spermidine synthase
MADHPLTPAATSDPLVRQQDGSLSLDFDNGTVQSRMIEADPAGLVLEYTRLMMGFLLFQPTPARIAMIGLGGGSLAKYCGLKLPGADFTAVEISPPVIALRDAFGIPPDGPHFRVRCADGAAFVRREAEPLDVLLVDGFDRNGQPAQLCSAAFYDACRDRLGTGGVLVVNLHSDDPACLGCVERVGQSFDGRIVVVEADDSDNLVVFAGTGAAPFPPPFSDLLERLRALEPAHPIGLGATMRKILQYAEPRHPPRRRRRRAR